MNEIGALGFTLGGILFLIASISNWEDNTPRNRWLVNLIGQKGLRILNGILGFLMLIKGIAEFTL